MSNLLSISITAINTIFSQLSFNSNIITWICSKEFDRQIFLHQNFNNHFAFKTDDFYNNMNAWREIILPEDKEVTLKKLYEPHRFQNPKNYLFYRTLGVDGQIKYICDNQFGLHDHLGNLVAYAGIVEILSAEIWMEKRNAYLNEIKQQHKHMTNDLSTIIAKEFHLEAKPNLPIAQQQAKAYVANYKDNLVHLSTREAETIQLLLKGMQTKHIARSMQISPRTVEAHINNICQKAKLNSRLELITQLSNVEQIRCWNFTHAKR